MNNSDFQKIYNDTAQFEVLKFKIALIVSGIIFVISLMVGIYLIFKKDNFIPIEATVVSQDNCNTLPNQPIQCNTVVSYSVNNTNYTNSIILSIRLNKSDPVQIEYDKTNPNSIQNPRLKLIYIGFILIGISLLFLGIAYLQYYFSTKSKIYAVGSGIVDATNFIKTTI